MGSSTGGSESVRMAKENIENGKDWIKGGI
jgi:hypothetical protein